MTVAQLYYLGKFAQSFNLGLRLLCPTKYSHISAAQLSEEIIAYSSDLPLDYDRCPREVADTMLRIAVKRRLRGWGGSIADGLVRTVSSGYGKKF